MTSTEQTEQQREQCRITEHATIASLVSLAVRDGILTARSGRHGESDEYVSVGTGDGIRAEDVKIGTLTREQYGTPARVYVDVRISRVQGRAAQTVEHDMVDDYWTLAIGAGVTTAASRWQDDYEQCGQSREPVAMVEGGPEFLPGFVKAWDAWHLNDMTAGCAHQTVVWEDGPYGRRASLEQTRRCPETGYKYGHAWLLRELPSDAVQTVIALLRQARSSFDAKGR